MLSIAPKGKTSPATPLSRREDQLLRRAFGRYAVFAERVPAADIVKRVQDSGPGHWILCDCLGSSGEDRPPALVPVASSHIRRHTNVCWPPHAPDCDFFREPEEQKHVTASFRLGDQPPCLIKGYAVESPAYRVHLTGVSQAEERSPLARLLLGLVEEAGLQRVRPGWVGGDLSGQYRALRQAASQIELADKVYLRSYLETYAPQYEAFRLRIEETPAKTFRKSRPHGIFITAARSISEGIIEPMEGISIPVIGRLSIFGEIEGHGRIHDAAARRPPYLVAALVARPDKDSPAAILRAYAHPVASRSHLLLLDSDNERLTLHNLIDLQGWLARARNVLMTIEKPQFDLGPEFDPAAPDASADARPPIIPDFVVRAKAASGREATVIVETMGYDDERYLERKRHVHPLMRAALGGALIVLHHPRRAGSKVTPDDKEFKRLLLRSLFQQLDPPGDRPLQQASA
jgi:hypothetical protein